MCCTDSQTHRETTFALHRLLSESKMNFLLSILFQSSPSHNRNKSHFDVALKTSRCSRRQTIGPPLWILWITGRLVYSFVWLYWLLSSRLIICLKTLSTTFGAPIRSSHVLGISDRLDFLLIGPKMLIFLWRRFMLQLSKTNGRLQCWLRCLIRHEKITTSVIISVVNFQSWI